MPKPITFRNGKPALNVKDIKLYQQENAEVKALIDALDKRDVQACYERALETFWQLDAPACAKAYGYGDVYSEGRSNGWLMVEKPPTLDAEEAEELELSAAALRSNLTRWAMFGEDIETTIWSSREHFHALLKDALSERQALERRAEASAAMLLGELVSAVCRLVRGESDGHPRIPRAELERLLNTYGDRVEQTHPYKGNRSGICEACGGEMGNPIHGATR